MSTDSGAMFWEKVHLVCNRMFQMGRAITLLVVAVVAMSACEQKVAGPLPPLAEGRPFPQIALNYSEKDNVTIQSFRGKVVVLNFWATWCPPCRREMPSLEQLSRTLDPNRFVVIGVSADEDALLAEEFLRQNHISFANFFDRGGKIAKQLGLKVYPETLLIGADGILLQRVPGLQEWSSPAMVAQLEGLYRNGNAVGTMSVNGGKQK